MTAAPRSPGADASPRGRIARSRAKPRAERSSHREPAPPTGASTLRARLAEAEDALRAIRAGEVDAVVVDGEQGPQVYTLVGEDHPYRTLIESMNEGALILALDKRILYANGCFARMVGCPLEQVVGSSLRRFLADDGRVAIRRLMRRTSGSGSTLRVQLRADDGALRPTLVSLRRIPRTNSARATVGVVVTDLTEVSRNEGLLRDLARRVVDAQELERGRVALELHDEITQPLCAGLLRSQALVTSISERDGRARMEATHLRRMIGQTAEMVERISRSLRPGVLEHLGLVAVLRSECAAFAGRTGVSVQLSGRRAAATGLSAHAELTLYRILQEALRNVERHAHARNVRVALTRAGRAVLLSIHDDGVGFDADGRAAGPARDPGLGIVGMRERSAGAGGTLAVRSSLQRGTTVQARIPVARDPRREPAAGPAREPGPPRRGRPR